MASSATRDRDCAAEPIGPALVARVTIASADDIWDAAVALNEAAAERGLRVAACSDIASKEPMVDGDGAIVNGEVFGWMADGERWWEDTRLALSSPLPRACRYESEPFWCNAEGFRTHWRNNYLEEMNLDDFSKRALCNAAIVVPVHLPFGQIGAVSFPAIDANKTDLSAEFAAHGDLLSTLARRFVAGYVGVMRTQRRMPSDCKLSKREVECLRWAAIGKTDAEIRPHHVAQPRHRPLPRPSRRREAERGQPQPDVFKAGQLGYLGAAS